jgi:hypothetical protein
LRRVGRKRACARSGRPFMIIELMKSTVKSAGRFFLKDQSMFACMAKFDILELTKASVFKTLWNLSDAGTSKVRPAHYKTVLPACRRQARAGLELTSGNTALTRAPCNAHGIPSGAHGMLSLVLSMRYSWLPFDTSCWQDGELFGALRVNLKSDRTWLKWDALKRAPTVSA